MFYFGNENALAEKTGQFPSRFEFSSLSANETRLEGPGLIRKKEKYNVKYFCEYYLLKY